MRKINFASLQKTSVSKLDHHSYICDISYFEGPLISLFRDTKNDWLYVWADTNGSDTERWITLPISREDLVFFLQKKVTLKHLFQASNSLFLMNVQTSISRDSKTRTNRKLYKILNLNSVAPYLPSSDSYFDENSAPDISLINQLQPDSFEIPIDGNWFVADLDKFSKIYTQLYAFIYTTGSRFITNLPGRIETSLRAPWIGGGSRVSLFHTLKSLVPAIHDLKINSFKYSSPGEISIEALKDVDKSIANIVYHYIQNEVIIEEKIKILNNTIDMNNYRSTDLSNKSNSDLNLSLTALNKMENAIDAITSCLDIRRNYDVISNSSPNIIVSSKVVLALLSRTSKLADLQKNNLIDETRWR